MQYVKYISNTEVEEPPINKDGIMNYNLDIERLIQDGYKELIPATIPPETEIRMYHFEYQENTNNIKEIIVYDETQQEAQERITRLEKERKTEEINNKIKELERMAVYEILNNNESNIEVYRDIINGLEETKNNL